MKYAIVLTVILLVGPAILFAQLQSQPPSAAMLGEAPSAATPGTAGVLLLNGKVTTEANSPPPESVNISLECGSTEEMAHAHSDSKGYFSISVPSSGHSSASYPSQVVKGGSSGIDLGTCELIADLAGYKAEPLRITRTGDIGPVNVGTIVLRAATPNQTFTVSLTSLAAPDKAKAAFEKGEEQKKKGKWSAAMDSFRKAIAAYPKYALAWLELGRVQATQKDFVDARQSFHESITQDSKLADGYVELAHLAAQQRQWQELAGATDHLVQIHPDAAEYWFLNSAANFNLGKLQQAEVSITRGIRLDSAHQLPQLEYLYGLILARKQDYQSAVEHISLYLKLSPQAADAKDAQRTLEEFQKQAQLATR